MVDSYWLLSKDGGISRTGNANKGGYNIGDGEDPDYLKDLPNYNKGKEVCNAKPFHWINLFHILTECLSLICINVKKNSNLFRFSIK